MDEEDIRENEEAKKLQTADDFAGFGSTENDPNLRGGWMDIFRAGGETMGIKLLKKMGWRDGQGIGPKVRRKPLLGDGDDQGSNETHLFAPENPRLIAFTRKTDHKGLGFQGEERLTSTKKNGQDVVDQEEEGNDFVRKLPGEKPGQKKKKAPTRGGFGVGILNDTGSDDEDPYEMGPKISYNRFIGQDKKKKAKTKTGGAKSNVALNPLLGAKPVFISKKTAAAKANAGYRKCHDGRLPLDGFVHGTGSTTFTLSEKKYEPPEIPKDWKSSKTASSTKEKSDYVSTADAAKASSLDPKSRAALLGEAQLPGKSVFDYMTPEARERLVKATGRTDLPPALSEKAPKGFEASEAQKQRSVWSLVPKLEKDVAVQALSRGASGWMPYAEDEDKRSRYRAFLEIRAGLRDSLPERVAGMGTDDWVNELHEFARAAEVFKPISGMMASRFTSSTNQPSVASDTPDSSTPENPLLREGPSKPEDPAETAAKMGMYGPMTRKTVSFYPSRLLCKRFNVRPPSHVQLDPGDFPGPGGEGDVASGAQPGGPKDGNGSKLELVSKDVMNQLMMESGGGMQNSSATGEAASNQAPQRKEIVVDTDRNEALESERPGADVFKAVFGSDDEDEDEE